MDGDVPPYPTNAYAAGKEAGEALLRYYARISDDLACTTLRFPLMVHDEQVAWYRQHTPADRPEPGKLLDVGFTLLALSDAADLISQIIEKQEPGYHSYLVAGEQNRLGWPIPRIVEQFYPNVPLHVPADKMTELVDMRAFANKFGWRPTHSAL